MDLPGAAGGSTGQGRMGLIASEQIPSGAETLEENPHPA